MRAAAAEASRAAKACAEAARAEAAEQAKSMAEKEPDVLAVAMGRDSFRDAFFPLHQISEADGHTQAAAAAALKPPAASVGAVVATWQAAPGVAMSRRTDVEETAPPGGILGPK